MKKKDIILKVENISKQYRLGLVGTGTISHDLNRWWYKIRGKGDPYLKVGDTNDRTSKGDSDYVWALKGVDFEVERGEVLGIIGKNGAGKSTLLKILSKVTGPTTGEIKTKGRIASLLEVGTGFHGEMTGRENIFLNGAILGMTKSEISSKINEIIEFSGCERYIDTPVKRYSSGMTVRLAFAVAAFLEPEILVIDEVLAVGDAEFQKKAIGKMQDISRGEGRTVLFVSHNMAAVKNLCTRAIVLENGSSSFEGEVEECIEYYISNNKNKETKLYYSANNKDNILQNIEIKNKLVASGSNINICFNLNVKAINLTNVHLGIYNFNDEKVLHISSEYFNNGYIKTSSDVLNCVIERNPLTQGLYYVNVGVVSNKVEVERLKKCLVFEVVNSDFFNCGIILKPASIKAKALAEYKWY
ncbi:ABC transporter ATP-binding protein [Algibacter pectinivorans]|uniref:Lipopolysaccharide transport system ATP-binding protein n=1 Tax=Algibacter pectinivorans TaxID=870482 RepID=A0A1I1NYJ0_9FLAO|nr:polysaccharide ABC transporter ATP-binding protein [Algibacter pectinivorans]SFD02525.1 lipopolysaccharide transport system ATP-binding protein [Algibacter pectinivorans]